MNSTGQGKCDAMSKFDLNTEGFDDLYQAMQDFQGNVEEEINDVLHNEAGDLIEEAIYRLMPVSGARWKGKKKGAKSAKSLMQVKENLSITVKSKTAYNYLYFPDDGSNTQKHVGNQQFFKRGGESQVDEIKDRCISRLVNAIED